MFDPASIRDPRRQVDFSPAYWPLCDGADAPPVETQEGIERRKIQFLSLYYCLNELYARLREIRSGALKGDDGEIVQRIQTAIQQRDMLEDFYEPEGFLGEPIMDGIFYKDVEFTYARRREFYELASKSPFKLFIPIPPPGTEIESWVREHLLKVFPAPASVKLQRGSTFEQGSDSKRDKSKQPSRRVRQ